MGSGRVAAMAAAYELVELNSGGGARTGMMAWVEQLMEKLLGGLTFTGRARERGQCSGKSRSESEVTCERWRGLGGRNGELGTAFYRPGLEERPSKCGQARRCA